RAHLLPHRNEVRRRAVPVPLVTLAHAFRRRLAFGHRARGAALRDLVGRQASGLVRLLRDRRDRHARQRPVVHAARPVPRERRSRDRTRPHRVRRLDRTVLTRGPRGQLSATGCLQPYGSGAAPRWMSTSALRRRIATGPGLPPPIVQPPLDDFTSPTGVITAAVPHAKASVTVPSALPLRHSSTLTRRSSAP